MPNDTSENTVNVDPIQEKERKNEDTVFLYVFFRIGEHLGKLIAFSLFLSGRCSRTLCLETNVTPLITQNLLVFSYSSGDVGNAIQLLYGFQNYILILKNQQYYQNSFMPFYTRLIIFRSFLNLYSDTTGLAYLYNQTRLLNLTSMSIAAIGDLGGIVQNILDIQKKEHKLAKIGYALSTLSRFLFVTGELMIMLVRNENINADYWFFRAVTIYAVASAVFSVGLICRQLEHVKNSPAPFKLFFEKPGVKGNNPIDHNNGAYQIPSYQSTLV